jgi:hypothetical protein
LISSSKRHLLDTIIVGQITCATWSITVYLTTGLDIPFFEFHEAINRGGSSQSQASILPNTFYIVFSSSSQLYTPKPHLVELGHVLVIRLPSVLELKALVDLVLLVMDEGASINIGKNDEVSVNMGVDERASINVGVFLKVEAGVNNERSELRETNAIYSGRPTTPVALSMSARACITSLKRLPDLPCQLFVCTHNRACLMF